MVSVKDTGLIDDGLFTPDVGAWGEQKYSLVQNYAQMFTASMKGKWNCRVYIDLFAGSGRARIRDSGRIVNASPLLALDIKSRFDKYIFCEENSIKIDALKERVSKAYPDVDPMFIHGDANKVVDQVLQEIPQHRPDFRVLSFCFADPYKLDNLKFETIRALAKKYMDFLILIPTGMDAHRNISYYIKPESRKVDGFLGTSSWRDDWHTAELKGEKKFGAFLLKQYCKEMEALGYKYHDTEDIRYHKKNFSLYRLAFFSRHELGRKFWTESKKYSTNQFDLFQK